MSEAGFVRFPAGSLDPGAQEFIPRNPIQIIHFRPPPPLQPPIPVYYPYPPPTVTEVVPYPTFSAPASYVSSTPETISVPLPLPPPAAAATRAVMLSSVPSDVSEMTVWREMEGFGEVRWVQMERACEGIVTVHFYDLRHAESALREIRDQYMQHQGRLRGHYSAVFMSPPPSSPPNLFGGPQESHHHHNLLNPFPSPPGRGLILGQAVWPQFVYPVLTSIPDGLNQGTIVIFNLDPAVTTSALRDIFQAFGAVKELRETPSKKHQRFVEFFDVRDAAKGLIEMNGKEINGKPVVIEFSRPGGHSRRFFNSAAVNNTPTVVSTNSSNVNLVNFPHQPPPQEFDGKFSRRTNALNVVPPRLLSRNKWSNKGIIGFSNNGSPSGSTYSSSSSSVESKMAVLNLSGSEETLKPKRSLKKSGQKGESSSGTQAVAISPKTQQQGKSSSSRGKKGRQAKKLDSRFLIKEDAISESTSGDSRTTVMIKNIPNKYSQKLLLNMLDNHCIHSNEKIDGGGGDGDDDEPLSAYDFVYLPIDFNNKCNVGYGFVNMTSPEATLRLYKAFHLQHWEVFNSRKICEVTYARVQGLDALKEHFKNSKFPCEMEHYLPVVFSPPRDGRQLTEPLPIVAPPTQSNHHSNDDDAHPVSLLLPPLHHLHQHHDVDTDAPVSACDSDDDSSGNGGVTADDDVTK